MSAPSSISIPLSAPDAKQPPIAASAIAKVKAVVLRHRIHKYPSRAWRGVKKSWHKFLQSSLPRTISLGVCGAYLRKGPEKEKTVLEGSFWTALARCAVHLLPSSVSIVLLVICCSGYFIGSELAGPENEDGIKIGALQVAAKIQELLIVSSLGDLIFDLARVELLEGEGLPLGLLGSGFSFTRISFFWSAEFLGAASWKPKSRRWRKATFLLVLLLAGIIALFAGPSTAVLMIPQVQEWPAGGTNFWLGGTREAFWPDVLPNNVSQNIFCAQNSTVPWDIGCLLSGYPGIYQFFSATQHPPTRVKFVIQDAVAFRQMSGHARTISGSSSDTWMMAPHASTAILQDALRSFWESAVTKANQDSFSTPSVAIGVSGTSRFAYAGARTSTVEVLNPLVRVVCSVRKEVYWNSTMSNATDITADFPVLQTNSSWLVPVNETSAPWADNRGPTLSYNVASAFQAFVTAPAFNESVISTRHIALPPKFGQASMGIFVAHSPWNVSNLWAVTGCTVDARWSPGVLTITDDNSGYSWDPTWGESQSIITVSPQLADMDWLWSDDLRIDDDPTEPRGTSSHPVTIGQDWFALMSPQLKTEALPLSGVADFSTTLTHHSFTPLDWLLSNMDLVTDLDIQLPENVNLSVGGGPLFVEVIVATMIADAMARVNVQNGWNGVADLVQLQDNGNRLARSGAPVTAIVPPPKYIEDGLLPLTMKQTISGYALSINGNFQRFAVAILTLHLLLALGHSIYMLNPWLCRWKRKAPGHWTSGAWDGIVDWIALALVSTPPPRNVLDRVGGGVRNISTMSRMAWINAIASEENDTSSRLELQFRGDGQENMTGLMRRRGADVKVDRKYA